jgi:hypothetical protein
MRRRILPLVAILVALLYVACSSSSSPSVTSSDAGVSDATTADETAAAGGPKSLGAACGGDTECATGLACVRNDGNTDPWPAKGLCTAPCSDDATCAAFDPNALCAGRIGSARYCLEGCTPGTPKYSSISSGMPVGKCHARNEMSCGKVTNGAVCFPECNDDAACGGGSCQASNGLCSKSPDDVSWSQIGQPETGGCASGIISGPSGFCTAICTIGVVPSCKWTGPGARANAACLRGPTVTGQGDLGECVELCDCDDDCHAPFKCTAFTGTLPMDTGRKGTCGTGGGLACGSDAGADGAVDGGLDASLDGG